MEFIKHVKVYKVLQESGLKVNTFDGDYLYKDLWRGRNIAFHSA